MAEDEAHFNEVGLLFNDKRLQQIHPMVGILKADEVKGMLTTRDTFYFGVFLPIQYRDKRVDYLCLISPEFYARYEITTPDRLNQVNLQLSAEPISPNGICNGWSAKSALNYIKSEFTPNKITEIFERGKDFYKESIEFCDEIEYILFPIWNIGTYFHPLFESYPYVQINGLKGSAKSKLLNQSSLLSYNGLYSGSITEASAVRLTHALKCSNHFDELEQVNNSFDEFKEFRNFLLNGYKMGVLIFRCNTEKKIRVERFDPYSPKMFANIKGIDYILADRCIPIVMRRTLNGEVGNKEINQKDPRWQAFRDDCHIFALENWKNVEETYKTLKSSSNKISNRQWELWKPLLTIAKLIGDETYQALLSYAEKKCQEKKEEEAIDALEMKLICALLDIVSDKNYQGRCYLNKEIMSGYQKQFDDVNETYWIKPKHLSTMLKRLGFGNLKRKDGAGAYYTLTKESVKDMAKRLGIDKNDGNDGNDGERKTLELSLNIKKTTTEATMEITASQSSLSSFSEDADKKKESKEVILNEGDNGC